MPFLVVVELAPPVQQVSGSFDEQWETAVAAGQAQQSFAPVEALYAATTGYAALGIDESDLEPGSLTSTTDGQLIEGAVGAPARWAHDGVTYRGCRLPWSSALYGAYGNPTFGNPHAGIVFEYCTFVGDSSDAGTARRAAVVSATTGHAVTFRHCDFSGGTSGVANDSAAGGAIVEYCWIHDLAAPIDPDGDGDAPHRTSLRTSAGHGRFRRNYCTDGGSSCISMYFDKGDVHDFAVEQNIMNGSSPNASPSYLINMKDGDFAGPATGVKVIGNLFGPQFQFGPISGADGLRWGEDGNEMSGSVWFLTGEPVGG